MAVNSGLIDRQVVVMQAKQLAPLSVGSRDAARLLSISERHLANLTASGAIPSLMIGGRRVYRVATLDKWLQAQEQAGGNSES